MIGEFEYFVLAAAAHCGDEAYGVSFRNMIEQTAGRPCSIGALYTTLDRLEAKGLIRTRLGEAIAERGGRAKRLVKLTAQGRRAGKEFESAIAKISRGLLWNT